MNGQRLVGLGMALLLWLAGLVPAFGAETALFHAVNFVRFSQPIALPDVSLRDLEGNRVSLRSFRGKVILLNFWATW